MHPGSTGGLAEAHWPSQVEGLCVQHRAAEGAEMDVGDCSEECSSQSQEGPDCVGPSTGASLQACHPLLCWSGSTIEGIITISSSLVIPSFWPTLWPSMCLCCSAWGSPCIEHMGCRKGSCSHQGFLPKVTRLFFFKVFSIIFTLFCFLNQVVLICLTWNSCFIISGTTCRRWRRLLLPNCQHGRCNTSGCGWTWLNRPLAAATSRWLQHQSCRTWRMRHKVPDSGRHEPSWLRMWLRCVPTTHARRRTTDEAMLWKSCMKRARLRLARSYYAQF